MKNHLYRSIILIFLFISDFFNAEAQNQNALQFDGADDKVTVLNASSLIAGSNAISLTCWVFPTNTNPAYPNFDGFAGFRNDLNADFYLLQISPSNTVEARFRSSGGVDATIAYAGLQLNTWQHLAFTYDGSKVRLYKNGMAVDSLPASGTISNSAVNFTIGDVVYTGADFYLTGKVDETSLWKKTLSAQEINCIYHSGIDSAAANLKLYYRFNQGTALGNNVGTQTLIDASPSHLNGTISNFAMTGATSNFVAGATNYTNIAAYICQGGTYSFNNQILSTAGNYLDTLTSISGCDSLLQLTLNILPVDTAVVQNGSSLTATHAGLQYTWVDCNNGYTPIPGETNQTFNALTVGSYAVIVKQGSCIDTSGCFTVSFVGINELKQLDAVNVYPNIASSFLNIDLPFIGKEVIATVTDINGRNIKKINISGKQHVSLDVSDLQTAIYFLRLESNTETKVFRFAKN